MIFFVIKALLKIVKPTLVVNEVFVVGPYNFIIALIILNLR